MRSFFCLLSFILSSISVAQSIDTLPVFPGGERAWCVSFNLSGHIFVGTGYDTSSLNNDFYQLDLRGNTWKQVASLPGPPRDDAISFVANGKPFVGMGVGNEGDSSFALNDLWCYDIELDLWKSKCSLPSAGRLDPFCVSIGNFVFVGGGRDNIRTGKYLNDFWRYNVVTDTWEQLPPLPFEGRFRAVSFGLDSGIYIGGGRGENGMISDSWFYSIDSNNWSKREDIYKDDASRMGQITFKLFDKAYYGLGTNGKEWFNDFYSYNSSEDKWQKDFVLDTYERAWPIVEVIENRLILGTGYLNGTLLGDFYMIKGF